MSEADTSNNQSLPEPMASMEDSTTNGPEASGTSEQSQIIHLPEFGNWRNIERESESESPTESEIDPSEIDTNVSFQTEVDNPSVQMPTERQSNDADWFALAQKMRQRNRRLHEQVMELRQALKDKQEALHLELMRSRDKESIIAQQAEEMNTVQEQMGRLFHALESSHQAAVRQQILIETLSEQLQSSQERIAQLERECALTQHRYNEQSNQLIQANNTCRELRDRLSRQQRQTLQFKAALEKSLEITSASHSTGQQPHAKGSTHPFFIPKTQPIQPWSADSEFLQEQSDVDSPSNQSTRLEPLEISSIQTEPFVGTKPGDEHWEKPLVNLEPPLVDAWQNQEEIHQLSTVDRSDLAQINDMSEDVEASELELEEQLLAEMSFLAEASGILESQPDGTDVQTAVTPEVAPNSEAPNSPGLYLIGSQPPGFPEDIPEETEAELEREEYWDSLIDDEPESPTEVMLPQSNWPSPVLYPLRPPKKRKSLAAIDLPSFPRYQPS